MKKGFVKKVCCILSVTAMATSVLPTNVFAIGEGNDNEQISTQEVTTTGAYEPSFYVNFDKNVTDKITGVEGIIHGGVEYTSGVLGESVHIKNEQYEVAEQYIDFGKPQSLQFGTEDFTISFLYKKDITSNKNEGAIISNKDWSSGDNLGFNFGDMRQGINMNYNAGQNGRKETDRYADLLDGEWHFVVGTFDRDGKMTLYIDGTTPLLNGGYSSKSNEVTISDQKNSIDAFNFILGADGKGQYGLENGYIDELKVYKSVLPVEEIEKYSEEYKIYNKLNNYENLINESDKSESKKEIFKSAINSIREKLKTAENIEAIKNLDKELLDKYNEFMDIKMSFEVISDTHIPGTDNTNSSNKKLINALTTIKNDYDNPVSVVLNGGDFSSGGGETQQQGYFNIIENFNDDFEFMTAMGNHDVRWLSGGWQEAEERYLRNNKEYMGDVPEGQSYYDKWINGYHFIVLNTQWDLKDKAYLSPEELEWLDETLAEGAEDNKPIFIVIHQSLCDTNEHSNEWPEGVQDHKLKEILRKYPQSFIFTGHMHDGLGAIKVERRDFGTIVDVPCMVSNDFGERRGELGYNVTVYEDRVSVNLRDYQNNTWREDYSYTFDMNKDAYPSGKQFDVSFDNNVNDSTINQNNGTISGDVTFVDGVEDKEAISIKNTNNVTEQYVDFNSLNLGTDDFTVMFWVKQNGENNKNGVILDYFDKANNSGFMFTNNEKQKIQMQVGSNKTAEYDISDGKWKAVTATFDRDGKMTLYINGVKQEEQDISSWKDIKLDMEKFIIGADSNHQNGANNISIDNLKIYKNVVGSGEIATTWTPYQVTSDKTSITIEWPPVLEDGYPNNDDVEPATLYLNGEKVADIESGETKKTINDLQPGTDYVLQLENHEIRNHGNRIDMYYFEISTKPDANKEVLQNLILDAEKIVEDIDKYTDESFNVFINALNVAKEVLNDVKATQEEVDLAVESLTNSIDNLKVKVDKSELEQLVKEVESLDLSKYTEESVTNLNKVLAEAKAMLEDASLTADDQAKVDEMVSQLQKAKDGLVLKDQGGSNKPEEKPDTKPDENKKPGNSSTPLTGDTAPIAITIGTLTVAIAGVLFLSWKKKKYQ